MKNWMLVCCYERDIETPSFFDTEEEAVKKMCAEFGEVVGITPEEAMEMRLEGKELNGSAYIGTDYAWADKHVPVDWKIFNLIGRV